MPTSTFYHLPEQKRQKLIDAIGRKYFAFHMRKFPSTKSFKTQESQEEVSTSIL